MALFSLVTAPDVQQQLADTVRAQRKAKKLSRKALAGLSTVPEATIKKFETTGQISLRQFLLLWQSVAGLTALSELIKETGNPSKHTRPRTIDDVLRS
ncbi:helix-turn-helix domain-containing protein [Sansalvadorimonas verongulae]|uniref:transcriptional regulator n=1 Tax=Sansalvadorimonas verongulae TaxID=2172824 RepID=UPI0012BC6ED0|nr:transcriptional regulator [Sansalvadorimonas verongulae]MTI12308.1 transcriptional regulator [Sansalvadorimonas verongulae]